MKLPHVAATFRATCRQVDHMRLPVVQLGDRWVVDLYVASRDSTSPLPFLGCPPYLEYQEVLV